MVVLLTLKPLFRTQISVLNNTHFDVSLGFSEWGGGGNFVFKNFHVNYHNINCSQKFSFKTAPTFPKYIGKVILTSCSGI